MGGTHPADLRDIYVIYLQFVDTKPTACEKGIGRLIVTRTRAPENKIALYKDCSMDMEERLARVESLIAVDARIERLERMGLRIAQFLLFVIALSAPIVWATFEFASFVIERFTSLRHSLGW